MGVPYSRMVPLHSARVVGDPRDGQRVAASPDRVALGCDRDHRGHSGYREAHSVAGRTINGGSIRRVVLVQSPAWVVPAAAVRPMRLAFREAR